MGFIGGVLRSTSGSNNPQVVKKVKNKEIQGQIDTALSDYKGMHDAGQTALSDYINKYLAGQGQFETQAGQESGAVGQFYTGEMANRLADLRAKRQAAVTGAADVATQQALRSVDQSRLSEQGGGSSYDKRLAIGALQPIRVGAAVDAANQERADLGYVTQNQLGLVGQRESINNAIARYGLAPYDTSRQMETGNLGVLAGITNLDQANKFYGLKKPTNKWADIADAADAGILNAAAIYGSVGGGGMGGGGGGAARGGLIWRPMEGGGRIAGPGTGTSDSIPVHVSDGEFVVRAEAVRRPGVLALLRRINAMGSEGETRGRRFGGGGLAGSAQQLNARSMEDLSPNFMPPTFVPTGFAMPASESGGGGGGGMSAQDYMQWARGMKKRGGSNIPQSQQDQIMREMGMGNNPAYDQWSEPNYGGADSASSGGWGGIDIGEQDFAGLRRGGLVRMY